jgi:hypothetical protein
MIGSAMNEDEIGWRRSELSTELEKKAQRSGDLGKRNHNIVVAMAICAVICSIAAGLLGLLGVLSSKWIGAIALLPAGLTIASSTLKLQAKATWYYENEVEYRNLLRQLKYELPSPPSLEDLSALSGKLRAFATAREELWRNVLALDWSTLGKGNRAP